MKYQPFNLDEYTEAVCKGPCFICQIVAGNPKFKHHIIYEDEFSVVFLNKYPSLYGYVLVAPRRHLEHAVDDFREDEYHRLHRVIYYLGKSSQLILPTERLYILSLGSKQGNSHIHWHVASLPPGVEYGKQQLESLSGRYGVLDIPDEEMASIATRIRLQLLTHLAQARA